jgi:hypothetical protein
MGHLKMRDPLIHFCTGCLWKRNGWCSGARHNDLQDILDYRCFLPGALTAPALTDAQRDQMVKPAGAEGLLVLSGPF